MATTHTLLRRAGVYLVALWLGLSATSIGYAADLPSPQGRVLLTVSGNSEAVSQGVVLFDRDMLDALPQVTFQTSTPWTDGITEFSGPLLKDVLDAVDAQGTVLIATAVNDYSVEIPVSDAVAGGPIVATLQNGAPMSLRNKGPLWIIYPFDANPAYNTESIYSRSIWQLDRIVIR